jgi:isopenicillin-N epimerase
MRHLFRLADDVIFLNHGSFGATPRPVWRAAHGYRKLMERQPVRFMQQLLPELTERALGALGAYVGGGDNVVFVPNATTGVNVVAQSLAALLAPGDEVLGTDHEYGACANAWEAVCARTGARYVRQLVPLPNELTGGAGAASANEQIVEQIWAGVTEHTRVLFLSHITSPTAQLWPVAPLIERARAAGIITLVDGAHAPGQIPLELTTLGADFYTGNCHKWLCAPKSAGFLYARAEMQHLLRPLVISWGSAPERQFDTGRPFRDAFVWAGTLDYSAYLAVPDAIAFQAEQNWDAVRDGCTQLLADALPALAAAAGAAPLYAGPPGAEKLMPPQMAITPLPAGVDPAEAKQRLLDEHQIEIPVTRWRDRAYVRVSVQGYTKAEELAALEAALHALRMA